MCTEIDVCSSLLRGIHSAACTVWTISALNILPRVDRDGGYWYIYIVLLFLIKTLTVVLCIVLASI